MDAVIHNAGIYSTTGRAATPEGHASVLAVNTLAPYMLTALIERPGRLIYLSSGMHRSGDDVFATTVPDPSNSAGGRGSTSIKSYELRGFMPIHERSGAHLD